MAMHACQIGLTDTATLCSASPHPGLCWSKREHFEANNLSAPISPLLTGVCERCDYTLPFLGPRLRCQWLPCVTKLNQPGSSSSVVGLLTANTGGWLGPALGAEWWRLLAASAALALFPSCGALSKWQWRQPGSIYLRFSA